MAPGGLHADEAKNEASIMKDPWGRPSPGVAFEPGRGFLYATDFSGLDGLAHFLEWFADGSLEPRRMFICDKDPRVRRIAPDQCAYGQTCPSGEGPIKKPTAILTTLDHTEDLERRRSKDHDHTTGFDGQRGAEGEQGVLAKAFKVDQIFNFYYRA